MPEHSKPIQSMDIKQVIAWSLYDFANSAYSAVIYTFVFSAYFINEIAPSEIQGTQLWGYTISASSLFVALLGPIIGTIADFGGKHKSWLFLFTSIGVISTAFLWFVHPNVHSIQLALTCMFISTVAFELAKVFYNSLLPNIVSSDYLGRVSGWGWACGYLGGLLCLILSLIVLEKREFFLMAGIKNKEDIHIIILLVAIWVSVFSLPIFLFVKQKKSENFKVISAVKKGLKELKITLKNFPQQRDLLLFLIARLFYMDGVNSLMALGGVFAAGTFHFSVYDVIIFGIILNITAGIGAALFAWIDDWIGSKKTVLIALGCFTTMFCYLLTIKSRNLFWMAAPFIGVFVGPIQAASRTFLARLAKPEEITRMYGFYSFSEKSTSFLGPFLVGSLTAWAGSQRIGMLALLPFFIVGGGLLLRVSQK
ncbi:MFS transporter [Legionella israelensis]|uniref:MFS transporter n=1 Tax=Legionella israelensis TaxID=454 RepID=A0AAX1EEM1_9GAMM|nr:MFS transporter [Legionella israelensis]QBR83561.1 MFS transporter [Legionella israelensis]